MTQADAPNDRSAISRAADGIRRLIRERRIGVNGLLPNYHQLCTEFGVSYMTVHRGMSLLERDGLVRRVRGKGTFVTRLLPDVPRELRHIGILYPSSRGSLLMHKPWLSEIMQGVSDAAPRGGDLHIFSIRSDGLVRAAQLQQAGVDGTLLLDFGNDDYLRAYASWGTPGVVLDYHPGDEVPLDHASSDNAAAAARMVEHLAALGHRSVAVVSGNPRRAVVDPQHLERTLLIRTSSDMIERREEALRALAGRGMQASDMVIDEEQAGSLAQTVRQLVQRGADRPTAVLADSDMTAHALLNELAKAGLRVPEDISVCAIAGCAGYARQEGLHLACCNIDFAAMGRWAVQRLAERCRQPALGPPLGRRIGFSFFPGTTTGPAPGRS